MTNETPMEEAERIVKDRAALEAAAWDMREVYATVDSALKSVLGESPLPQDRKSPSLSDMSTSDLIAEIGLNTRTVRDLVIEHVPVIMEKMQSPMARMAIRTFSGIMGKS